MLLLSRLKMSIEHAGWANWCPRQDCWSSQRVPVPDRRLFRTETGILIQGTSLSIPESIATSENIWYAGWFFRFAPSAIARPVVVKERNEYFLASEQISERPSKLRKKTG